MQKLREILRQKLVLRRSHRDIACSVGTSAGAVGGATKRAEHAGLSWEVIETMSDDVLEERLYGPRNPRVDVRPLPEPTRLHVELRRPGVTLELLHLEYLAEHPDGFRYTKFCEVYRQWVERQKPTMRQVHTAGDAMFVDYSGKTLSYVERATGEVVEVELFVAVLGASNLTYVEATRTQRVADFIGSHVRALSFFGGVPRRIVPDQLKSAVTWPCRYEPGLQRTYEEMARHYGTAIVPARPARPRDKAKVEVGVQVVQRWVLARLRNRAFSSLAEINAAIAPLREELNARVMKTFGKSRQTLFDEIERAALAPLPERAFECAEWKMAKVNIDYHVEYDHHFYSVPYTLLHERVEVRATATMVEILHRHVRVASHARSMVRGRHTTVPEHMPAAHQKHAARTPSRLTAWARTIGPSTGALVEAILEGRRHPEHGYRSCLGLLRLGKRYSDARLEAACLRALAIGARSYRNVASILEHGLDHLPLPVAPTDAPSPSVGVHENVRGPDYYH
jgi:transposase